MPLTGLSLFAYLNEAEALTYLSTSCSFADPSPQALLAHWYQARGRLGDPIPNAGKPTVEPIGVMYQPYLDRVTNTDHFKSTVGTLPWTFGLVEIDPLLCYQMHILTGKAAEKWKRAVRRPSLDRILRQCLTLRPTPIPQTQLAHIPIPGQPIFRILSRDLSVAMVQARAVKGRRVFTLTLDIGVRSPLVQVISFEGRYCLRNGFHRAYRLRQLGITHIPCIVIEPSTFEEANLAPGFARHVLDSPNPPTCGHFTLGRTYLVNLREAGGVIDIACKQGAILLGA